MTNQTSPFNHQQGDEPLTVSIQLIKSHIQRFQAMGGKLPIWVENSLNSNEAQLDDSDVRFPVAWVKYAIEYAADHLNDPVLGLNHPNGEEPLKEFVEELLLRSSSLAEFIWLYSRYFCVFTEIGDFSIAFGKDNSAVRFDPKNADLLSYHQFDAAIYGLKLVIERASDVRPEKLLKEHSPPKGYELSYKEKFGCEVVFNQNKTALIYNTEDLLENFESNQSRRYLEDDLPLRLTPRNYRDQRDALYGKNLKDEIIFLITRLLFRGVPSRHQVAKELNLSVRTLQRSLSEMNTSYKDLLEVTRKKLAVEYLKESGFTVAQTATLLGYTETSQFYKAFRRWYGKSPRERCC